MSKKDVEKDSMLLRCCERGNAVIEDIDETGNC